MRRRLVTDGPLAAAGVTIAGVLVLVQGSGLAEWVFGSVCLIALLFVARVAWRAQRTAVRQQRTTAELADLEPNEVARRAVVAERERLSGDLTIRLRSVMDEISDVVAAERGSPDRIGLARRIHALAELASIDLRRQLGLLRQVEPSDPVAVEADVPTSRPSRSDVVIGVATACLAAIEATAYLRVEDRPWSLLAVVLTALAGGLVTWRRAAPGAAAIAIGLLFGASAVFDAPIVGGFWCLVSIGGLLWTIVARSQLRTDWWSGALLFGAASVSMWLVDRENAPALIAVMAAAALVGLVTRYFRAREHRSSATAAAHQAALSEATESAVAAERIAFARDIHDAVSHGVGVVAVQAAAAEVSWPAAPEAYDAALDIIETTTRATAAELDRLMVPTPSSPRTEADVVALVERIRAAGTSVEVVGLGSTPLPDLDVVYGVVQESLTNVVRHGGGATVVVRFLGRDGTTVVEVCDDGPGAVARPTRGFGLVGLNERVARAGGRLSVGNRPGGGGFRVAAELPVREPVR